MPQFCSCLWLKGACSLICVAPPVPISTCEATPPLSSVKLPKCLPPHLTAPVLFVCVVCVCVGGGGPRTCVGKLVEARQVNVGVFFSLSPRCFLRRLLTEPETHSVGWSSYWPVSPRILLSSLCCAGITGTSSCQLLPVCSGDSEEGRCKGRAVSSTLLAPVTLSACSKGA